ncbi:MAG: ABC transporter permease [Bacteroidota bacterium]
MVGEEKYYEPPGRPLRLLRWFCADHFLDEVEGDLWELYQEEVEQYGEARARRRFYALSIRYIRPYFFDRNHLSFQSIYTPDMIRHFFKLALRQLRRQRFYALINISGFALGLAACLLIGLFLRHELSYDEFFSKSNDLYRITVAYNIEGRTGHTAVTSTPLGPRMQEDIPEVVRAARIAPSMYDAGNNQIRRSTELENRYESGFTYADSLFLEMFDFPLVMGELSQQLREPRTMLLTERKAKRLFGAENPIGQQIVFNNNEERAYTITGVLADLPSNTHFQFDYLLSMSSSRSSQQDNWGFNNFVTYAELIPGTDPELLTAKLVEMIKERNEEYASMIAAGNQIDPILQPIREVHLRSVGVNGFWQHGNYQYIYLFGGVALFILLLACINFVNLATARSSLRALETGMRRVLGSLRQQLVLQFLLESVLLSALALLLALGIAVVGLSYFNELVGRDLQLPWTEPGWYALILGGVLVLGILVGAYPAVVLSGFEPLKVLKGYFTSGRSANRFRSQLVVFQFTIAIVLVAGTLVVREQLHFLQDQQLGFDKEQLMIVEGTHILEQPQAFRQQLQQLSSVHKVSMGGYVPVEGYFRNGSGAWRTGADNEKSQISLEKWYVDHEYVSTLDMELVAGRDFSRDMATDSTGMVLNESAVKELGLEDPVGARVSSYTYMDQQTGELYYEDYTVIGVVKDFHFESLHNDIRGMSLVLGGNTVNTLVRLNTDQLERSIQDVKMVWAELAPGQPFRYKFLDEQYQQMYAFEQRAGSIMSTLTGLAIFVACLGLFALATFMAQQRRHEVGVRKVLGASTKDIVVLLTKRFVLLVVLAILLATPIAWWFARDWLSDFAYRIELRWPVFALAGGLALMLSVATMSFQALRAAWTNPVDTIRRGE